MLVIQKIEGNMCEVLNTRTGTPFDIPTHWLQVPGIQEGDVIKIVKDEVTPRRVERQQYEEAKRKGITHMFDWKYDHERR
ncbi:MAG: hypothetical protein ACOC3B_02910 [Bacillota bacterium]